MEGQLQRTHDHHRHQEDPLHHAGLQSVMEGEVEAEHNHNHHGEKKSVLTKVKDKAKKIKEKIKHAGHPHDDDDYDYDDDDDEETINRSDLHAAPIVNESAFISGTALPKQTGLNLDNPTVPLDEAYDDIRNAGARHDEMYSNDPFMNTSSLPVQSTYNPNIRAQDFSGLGRETDHRLPTSFESEQRAYVADPTVKIGPLGGFEVDPHGHGAIPPSNYQSKVTDPTRRGGEEADVSLLLRRLDNPGVDDKSQRKTESYTTGGEEVDVTPVDTPVFGEEVDATPVLKRLDNFHVDDAAERKTESYTGGSEEVDVTPLLDRLDNLHVDDESQREMKKTESEEMDYTGSHDQFTPTTEHFNPKSFDEEMPEAMPQDTVAGKISAATSVITDKAAAAKNAVASRLGYGGSTVDRQEEVEVDRPQRAPVMDTVSEYGHRVAEQLAPVYEKAAGAGSVIMSKVKGRGGGGEGGDKGVSVQGYLVEKLRPGEEDRELSKVITEAIHGTQRRGEEQQPVKETVTVEAVAADEKAAAGVVDRVKGAIGSWLGKKGDDGEGLEREIGRKLQE